MRRLILVPIAFLIACSDGGSKGPSTPLAPLIPCNPEICDPPRACHPIDGVDLCVLTCPGGTTVCDPDEMPLTLSGSATCTCVPQRPSGRACGADGDCGWGPDVSGAEHLCVSHGGGSTCQPLGVSCRTGADCSGGYTCETSTRVCVKPVGALHTWRRDADGDVRCTGESQVMANPGPGPGWRTDCLAVERPECDDYKMFTCAPDDRDLIGSVLRVGTVHTPGLSFTSEGGERYAVAGHLIESLSQFEGGNRVRVSGRVTGANLHVTGWWLEGLAGGDTPLSGLLRLEGDQHWLDAPSGRRRITSTSATVNNRLSTLVGWKVWVVGKQEGDAYRIWRLGQLYKPDAP